MPTSKAWGKPWLDALYEGLWRRGEVRSVVDVGTGRGTFAMRLRDRHPGVRWVGIEAWAPYVDEYDLHSKYDELVVGDAMAIDFASLGDLDVAFFGDVLEHLPKRDALTLLARVQGVARFAFVSIPIHYLPQDAVGGNPYEEHRKPDWSHSEALASFRGVCAAYREGFSGVYALATRPDDAELLATAFAEAPASAVGDAATVEWVAGRSRLAQWLRHRARRTLASLR